MFQPLRIFEGLSLSLSLSLAETKLVERPTAVQPRAII